MDHGPWSPLMSEETELNSRRVEGVASADFRHDVVLRVSGDFASPAERAAYCDWLVTVLNTASERVRAEHARSHPETD